MESEDVMMRIGAGLEAAAFAAIQHMHESEKDARFEHAGIKYLLLSKIDEKFAEGGYAYLATIGKENREFDLYRIPDDR